jgi:hypothetical protein
VKERREERRGPRGREGGNEGRRKKKEERRKVSIQIIRCKGGRTRTAWSSLTLSLVHT